MFIHKYSFSTQYSPEHAYSPALPQWAAQKGLGWTLSVFLTGVRGNSRFPLTDWAPRGPGGMTMIPRRLFKGRVLQIFLSYHHHACTGSLFSLPMFLLCFPVWCRWPGVPGHALPTAAVYEEPQQWDAGPPEEQRDLLGARGDLHAVLLHALPSDGVGEPQRGAFEGYLTNREVRSKQIKEEQHWTDQKCINPGCTMLAGYSKAKWCLFIPMGVALLAYGKKVSNFCLTYRLYNVMMSPWKPW